MADNDHIVQRVKAAAYACVVSLQHRTLFDVRTSWGGPQRGEPQRRASARRTSPDVNLIGADLSGA